MKSAYVFIILAIAIQMAVYFTGSGTWFWAIGSLLVAMLIIVLSDNEGTKHD